MNNIVPQYVIDTVAAMGFDVYQSEKPEWRTYLYFTDGKRIGYLQNDRLTGITLTTVNKPCRECGTGFRVVEFSDLSRAALEQAFVIAPWWGSARGVVKYKNIEEFLASEERQRLPLIKVASGAH